MLLNTTFASFKNQFNNKLSEMLSANELGSFILVLANSMQDTQLHQSLKPQLEATFKDLKKNNNLTAGPDDIAVFDALKTSGISQFSAWQNRGIGDWQCALNSLRALKPERSSKEQFNGLHQAFNDDAFHFSKPFLRPEIISEEVFENINLQLMYHKFPFVPFHLLIVLEAAQQRPQYLNQEIHRMACHLVTHLAQNIDGFGLSYNSLGAGASVNHLHIHGFIIDEATLPIEQSHWKHNGGAKDYPLKVSRLASIEDSWQLIERLHQNNQPYNLLYRSGRCYIIQRMPQGSVATPKWLSNVGWYDVCGGFNLSDESYYHSLTADSIKSTLTLLSI